MKTKFFAVLLALLGISVTSCEKNLNSPPEPLYLLTLKIVDQNGNNVLQDVERGTIDSVYNEAICIEYGKQKIRKPRIVNTLNSKENYLILQTAVGIPIEDCPNLMTWKFRSKDIFGDQQTHTIESSWERYGESYTFRCTSFEFEGKTYVPELENGYWTARVVVNR